MVIEFVTQDFVIQAAFERREIQIKFQDVGNQKMDNDSILFVKLNRTAMAQKTELYIARDP